jgi:hypothetical protein
MPASELVPTMPTMPNRVPTEGDKLRSHELRQQLILAGDEIDISFRRGAVAIIAFLQDPVLMRVQGWDTEEEFWQDPDVQRVVRVELGSQMLLESYVQRQRAKFMLWAHATFPQIDWTQVRHSTVTQTGRAKALRDLAERAEIQGLDAEAVSEEAERIVFADEPTQANVKEVNEEPAPVITVRIRNNTLRLEVDGEAILELVPNVYGIRFASMALHLESPRYRVEEDQLVVYHGGAENSERDVVGRFLVAVQQDDPRLVYLLDKTHTRIAPG